MKSHAARAQPPRVGLGEVLERDSKHLDPACLLVCAPRTRCSNDGPAFAHVSCDRQPSRRRATLLPASQHHARASESLTPARDTQLSALRRTGGTWLEADAPGVFRQMQALLDLTKLMLQLILFLRRACSRHKGPRV